MDFKQIYLLGAHLVLKTTVLGAAHDISPCLLAGDI